MKTITRIINLTLKVSNLTQSLVHLLWISCENHDMILGQTLLKNHEVIVEMREYSSTFHPGHWSNMEPTSSMVSNDQKLLIKTEIIKIEKVVTSKKMIKKSLNEDIMHLLQTINKLSDKMRNKSTKTSKKQVLDKSALEKLWLAVQIVSIKKIASFYIVNYQITIQAKRYRYKCDLYEYLSQSLFFENNPSVCCIYER